MNRFHNKYHRHNHHTLPKTGEPDSSHDPIASPQDPFQGDFYINGTLSAKQGIFDSLTYTGTNVNVNQLKVSPLVSTNNFYFKIDSNFTSYPLAEMYVSGQPAFVVTSSKLVGIGTASPTATLHVSGNTICANLTASNVYSTTNLTVTGSSQLGYLQVNYSPGSMTKVTTTSGNKDLYFYTNTSLNLQLLANNTNIFSGKVGIGTTPTETFTLSGSQSFRKNGIILLDNSYYNTFRIVTNRQAVDDNHLYTFTEDGRYIVGDVYHDGTYTGSATPKIFNHKINALSKTTSGKMLSLTNFTPNASDEGPVIEFFRANGLLVNLTPAVNDQKIGGINSYGYNNITQSFSGVNASINFYAANTYTAAAQGAYITLNTVSKTDTAKGIYPRLTVSDIGNVGIGTNMPSTRLHIVDGNSITGTSAGTNRDVLTLSTANDLNGILFSSTVNALQVRAYTKVSNSTFNIDVGSSTNALTVNSSGNATIKGSLTVATTSYTSDARLKLNAKNISNSLEKVTSLNGVYFTWDESKQDTQKGTDIGVLAQDVEKILPGIVSTDNNGFKTVQYHKLIPLLIESIKELKKEIDELKHR